MNRNPYDPLADHFARGRIGQAQFWAGREFQKHFGIADRRSEDRAYTLSHLERERPGTLTDDQLAAWKWLAKCYRQLGADGSALVHDVLVRAMTAKQIVEFEGQDGARVGAVLHQAVLGMFEHAGCGLRVLETGKENSRLWRQNPDHWRAVTRPGWDAQVIQQLSPHQQGHAHACREIHPADGNAEEPCLTRRSPAGSEHLPARPGQIAGRQQ